MGHSPGHPPGFDQSMLTHVGVVGSKVRLVVEHEGGEVCPARCPCPAPARLGTIGSEPIEVHQPPGAVVCEHVRLATHREGDQVRKPSSPGAFPDDARRLQSPEEFHHSLSIATRQPVRRFAVSQHHSRGVGSIRAMILARMAWRRVALSCLRGALADSASPKASSCSRSARSRSGVI
jgi:hypothetical protein